MYLDDRVTAGNLVTVLLAQRPLALGVEGTGLRAANRPEPYAFPVSAVVNNPKILLLTCSGVLATPNFLSLADIATRWWINLLSTAYSS